MKYLLYKNGYIKYLEAVLHINGQMILSRLRISVLVGRIYARPSPSLVVHPAEFGKSFGSFFTSCSRSKTAFALVFARK